MATQLLERPLARRNTNKSPATEPARDRIDLRADPAWVARLEKQAERYGMTVSAYIRRAVSKELEQDEATDPAIKRT